MWSQKPIFFDGFHAVNGLATHLPIDVILQYCAQTVAEDRTVIND